MKICSMLAVTAALVAIPVSKAQNIAVNTPAHNPEVFIKAIVTNDTRRPGEHITVVSMTFANCYTVDISRVWIELIDAKNQTVLGRLFTTTVRAGNQYVATVTFPGAHVGDVVHGGIVELTNKLTGQTFRQGIRRLLTREEFDPNFRIKSPVLHRAVPIDEKAPTKHRERPYRPLRPKNSTGPDVEEDLGSIAPSHPGRGFSFIATVARF